MLYIMDSRSRIATIRIGDNFGDGTPDIQYNLEDNLGSSVTLLKDNGANINKEEYYPFGETSFGSYAEKCYKYCGKERDAESGLYYYGARYYVAWTCRFISVDPLASKYSQMTPYNYADQNPINDFDIDGMQDNNSQEGGQTIPAATGKGNSTADQAVEPIPESKKISCHQADQTKNDQTKSVKDLINNLKPTSNILSKEDNAKVRDWVKNNASSPQDIILEEMKTLVDKSIPYSQNGNRTDLSEDGLAKLDCSETVSVYLKKLSIMATDKQLYTGVMTSETKFREAIGSENISFVEGSNSSDFTPQKGDIFVWRNNGVGHTGIVYSVDGDKITILEAIGSIGSADEAYNKSNGGTTTTDVSRTSVYLKSGKALAGHAGWIGYFRPLTN